MSTLKLQEGIIYGPIDSRRFGPSLGLNLLPTDGKVCSFNCIYCHYGWTFLKVDSAEFISDSFPSVDEVGEALRKALEKTIEDNSPLNVITFSGNGEPTLHPDFPMVVDRVLHIRDELTPNTPVQALSNFTTFKRPEVVEALRRLDRRIMKLDAGTEDLFSKINRPAPGITLAALTDALRKLGEVFIQSAFMAGRVDNSTDEAVQAWLERLQTIKPLGVQIYTLDRSPADSALERVAETRLEEIATLVRGMGLEANIF